MVSLYPFQREGARFLKFQRRALLADDMGLGKSAQALAAARGRTLIVAPAMALDSGVWSSEITKWGFDPAQFAMVSYTSLHKLDLDSGVWFDTVILDEVHHVKNRHARRTDLVRQVCATAGRVYMLTGTPVPNWAFEMFTLLQLARPADAIPGGLLGSYWRWVGEWFDVHPGRFSKYEIGRLRACSPKCDLLDPSTPCEHYGDFLAANWGTRFLRRTREQVLPDLPALTSTTVLTPMTASQATEYRRMKRDYLVQVGVGVNLSVLSEAAKFVSLCRLSTGVAVVPGADFVLSGSSKLLRLRQDLWDRFFNSAGAKVKAKPVLVFAWYRESVAGCAAVAEGLGLRVAQVHGGVDSAGRGAAIAGFQAGEVDVLVGSLSTLRESVTLTRSDLVIFVEQAWVPAVNEQALRRIHRLGQESPVTALWYLTPGTVDVNRDELVSVKQEGVDRLFSRKSLDALL